MLIVVGYTKLLYNANTTTKCKVQLLIPNFRAQNTYVIKPEKFLVKKARKFNWLLRGLKDVFFSKFSVKFANILFTRKSKKLVLMRSRLRLCFHANARVLHCKILKC